MQANLDPLASCALCNVIYAMTSKLDYLKKYLAQPGGDDSSPKKEKKKKKSNTSSLNSGLLLRDDSDIMPASKAAVQEQKKFELDVLKAKRRNAFNQGKDSDDDMVVVDQKEAEKAAKVSSVNDDEKSGISWTMKMHVKKPSGTRVKPEIKEESPPRGRPPPSGPNKAPQKQAPAKLPWENGDGSDADLSPPRAGASKVTGNDSDLSPPRGAVKNEDSDLSPPRAAAAAGNDSDLSPPRAAQKPAGKKPAARGDDSDLSPPRAAKQPTIKKEEEPPIKKELQSDDDLSPPRASAPGGKKTKVSLTDSDADLSPPRNARHDSDADLSPPRAKAPKQRHDSDAESDLSPPRKEDEKMASGATSGLVRGEDLRKEAAELREKRKRELEAMPDELTGRDAATVYRNRDGLKIDREEWAMQQQKKKKKKLSDYPEQEIEWGGGVKQKVDLDAEKKRLAAVAAEPLARFVPTADFEAEMRDQKRWSDPMNKFKDQEEEAERERRKKARPKCPHRAPPNRYNIEAGYRWDGKVRGTGYEEKWFKAKNVKEYTKQKHMADMMSLPE